MIYNRRAHARTHAHAHTYTHTLNQTQNNSTFMNALISLSYHSFLHFLSSNYFHPTLFPSFLLFLLSIIHFTPKHTLLLSPSLHPHPTCQPSNLSCSTCPLQQHSPGFRRVVSRVSLSLGLVSGLVFLIVRELVDMR